MTLLHQRQQRQMSAIEESQEQEVNSVVMTRTKIKPAEVCKESTTPDDKGDDTAETTQAHFAEVTDILDEATCFSQS